MTEEQIQYVRDNETYFRFLYIFRAMGKENIYCAPWRMQEKYSISEYKAKEVFNMYVDYFKEIADLLKFHV